MCPGKPVKKQEQHTLDFANKKHVIFGQVLDFLTFSHGNRRENEENG